MNKVPCIGSWVVKFKASWFLFLGYEPATLDLNYLVTISFLIFQFPFFLVPTYQHK